MAIESAEGNLFCDLMLAARPDAQVALTNGGGLRADLPAGELTYGQLFEAMPFDNRFAIVDVKGSHLRSLVSTNLQRGGGILSWGGLTAKARCKAGKLDVEITVAGKPLVDDADVHARDQRLPRVGRRRRDRPAQAPRRRDQDDRRDHPRRDRRRAAQEEGHDRSGAAAVPDDQARLDYEGKRPVECGGKPARGPTGARMSPD